MHSSNNLVDMYTALNWLLFAFLPPQEQWGWVSEGGVRCSKSLVDMYTALCSVAEENARVAAAHITYAALLEKTLSKVALQHVISLERLCLVSTAVMFLGGLLHRGPNIVAPGTSPCTRLLRAGRWTQCRGLPAEEGSLSH